MLFYASILLIVAGIFMTVYANRKYGDDAPSSALRKIGWTVLFIGAAAFMFVATCNILVMTGRAGIQ